MTRTARLPIVRLAVLAAALVIALPALTAQAKKLTPRTARNAAYRAGVKIGRKTHASATKVLGCRRSTSVRYFCQIQNTFRSGASRCVADVTVSLSRQNATARAKVTKYLCY